MSPKILAVLNDDRTFLRVLERLLTHAGYTVVIGEIGSTRHQLIHQEQPDLVVVDMQRHHPATGWKCVRALRRDPATTTLPVLVCSSAARLLRERPERVILSNVKCALHATEFATRHTAKRGDVVGETPQTPQPPVEPHDPVRPDVPVIPPHPQDPAGLPAFPPAPDGPAPIGPAPSPEMEPRPPMPPRPPSSPDDLPETQPSPAAAHFQRCHDAGEMPQPDSDPDPHPRDPLPPAIPPHRPEPDHWPWQEPDPDAPWPEPDVTTPSARAIVVRQVVRVPVQARSGGLVGRLAEHEATRIQLLAVAVFVLLVLLSWIG